MDQQERQIDRPPGDDRPVRLIYVMGFGRSGSTVLASVLGNHPDVFTAGEIALLPRCGWATDGFCACGEPTAACTVWSDVRRRWVRETGSDDPAAYDRLTWGLELLPPRTLLELRRRPSDAFRQYVRQTGALLRAIRDATGRPVVVDSSKGPGRALALAAVPGIDLRVIHLVRDVRGVVWSLQKNLEHNVRAGVIRRYKPRPAWRSALGWARLNRLALRVCEELPRVIRVRYEDFVTRPDAVLAEVGRLAGLDFRAVARDLAAGRPLEIGHVAAGNRMRMAGRVKLVPDVAWKAKLRPADRWIAGAMAGRLLREFGYAGRETASLPGGDGPPREAAA